MPTASAEARLSPAAAAALWLAGSAIFGAAVAGFLRFTADDVDPVAIPFYRAVLAAPLVLPWLFIREKSLSLGGFAPRAGIALHLARAVAMVCSILFFVQAMIWMSIADATALALVGPVIAVALAAGLFGERTGTREWLAVAVGLGGALIVIGPKGEATPLGIVYGLLTAAAVAADWLLLKRIARSDGMGRATAWLTVLMVILALPLALSSWSVPGTATLLALAGAALCGTLAQALSVRAFALSTLWHLTALSYLSVPLAAAIGWAFFSESVKPWTLIGGAAIVAASVALAHFRAKRMPA